MIFSVSSLRQLLTAMCATIFNISVHLLVSGGLHVVSADEIFLINEV